VEGREDMRKWVGGHVTNLLTSQHKFILYFTYTVSLRLQVSSEKVVEKAFGEYAFCCLLLFFVVFNFIG